MLRWCAYCQRFQGEVAPFENLSHTHGICTHCKTNKLYLVNAQIEHAHKLRKIQDLLMQAGKVGDISVAHTLVNEALTVGVRPVEILLGLVSPSLYLIGEQWQRGAISVAEEHQFTSFCEKIFDVIDGRLRFAEPVAGEEHVDVLLLNAHGNRHTLGIRTLSLWFKSRGISARILDPETSPEYLIEAIRQTRPKLILISIALADQRGGLLEIISLIDSIPSNIRPRVIVGGNAVKSGLMTPISGVTFLEDITQLEHVF
jgi:methanogenic corrinoid protein MtbC1